jgi:hypothetical protein
MLKITKGVFVIAILTAVPVVPVEAQWPKYQDSGVPRDARGNVLTNAPAPRTADGKPDFSGLWMRANRAAPEGRGGRGAPAGNTNAPFTGGRGGVPVDLAIEPFLVDPNGPPLATFFEAGADVPGGMPYTPWGADLRKQRRALNSINNPDANCLPLGILQFHLQPQPRKIVQTSKLILIEYESNYGIRHIYLDGRSLPPQGEPLPWWYGYSVGHWEGDTLVVETNNLRGAEDSPFDGWLDQNGTPFSRGARFVERFRRTAFDHLQIDVTVDDPKTYTKPVTLRVDQRILPDQELIEFICNENQQFRKRIKVD